MVQKSAIKISFIFSKSKINVEHMLLGKGDVELRDVKTLKWKVALRQGERFTKEEQYFQLILQCSFTWFTLC